MSGQVLISGKGKGNPFHSDDGIGHLRSRPGATFEKYKNVFQETTAGKHFAALSPINNSLLRDSRVTPKAGMPSWTR